MYYQRKLALAVCLLTALVSLPSNANENQSQNKYHCHGGYGDAQDAGLWDWIFIAGSASDAAAQAKQKFKPQGHGAWVGVFECRLVNES